MGNELKYAPKSAWKHYERESQNKLHEFARKYIDFLSACKTEKETVNWAVSRLKEAGYTSNLQDSRIIMPFRDRALAAFRLGKNPLDNGLRIIAAHADSPRLDFKQHPFVEQAGVAQARTHYYGGIRKYQWLARPLALHGVIVLENGQKINVNIGDAPDEPVFCVADLLPHLAQKQEKQKVSEAFDAEKMNVILGHEPMRLDDGEERNREPVRERLLELVNARFGIREEDMISAEIEVVPAGRARFVGLDTSMIGGYGQDDRICVFCAVEALANAKTGDDNVAVILWDKEEIGSDGASGASSRFFEYAIREIASVRGNAAAHRVLMNSSAISADVTAALDPDYQDVHEKSNAALLGYGPCFAKYTGSRGKYGASEAPAEFFASLRAKFNVAGIPWQAAELGKVDSGGGGTVALFLAAYGMNVIDLGPALLSMHSPFEISSVADLYATYEAYKIFLE